MEWKYGKGRVYSTDEKNQLIAETTFAYRDNGVVNIDHTFVIPALRGKGVSGEMMEVVAEYLRENGLKATATCWFANDWLHKNQDAYSDIISKDSDNEGIACKIDGKH